MPISDIIKYMVKERKQRITGVLGFSLLLGTTLLPSGCTQTQTDYAAVMDMEQQVYDEIQKQPYPDKVEYEVLQFQNCPQAIGGAEFTIDNVKYTVATPFFSGSKGRVLGAFAIKSDNGAKSVTSMDAGSEQSEQAGIGNLDGRIDAGNVDGKTFDKYTGQNSGLRNKLQMAHNRSLKIIFDFFKQQ